MLRKATMAASSSGAVCWGRRASPPGGASVRSFGSTRLHARARCICFWPMAWGAWGEEEVV